MGYSAARKAKFSRWEWVGFSFAILFSLIFLLSGSIPLLMNLPKLQRRFTGVETTARARAERMCDDGGHYFAFTFTDRHEKVYHLTNHTCYSGVYRDGQQVTLWYQPNDPSNFITDDEVSFELSSDLPFLIGCSVPFFFVLGFFLFYLNRYFRRSRTLREKTILSPR